MYLCEIKTRLHMCVIYKKHAVSSQRMHGLAHISTRNVDNSCVVRHT